MASAQTWGGVACGTSMTFHYALPPPPPGSWGEWELEMAQLARG